MRTPSRTSLATDGDEASRCSGRGGSSARFRDWCDPRPAARPGGERFDSRLIRVDSAEATGHGVDAAAEGSRREVLSRRRARKRRPAVTPQVERVSDLLRPDVFAGIMARRPLNRSMMSFTSTEVHARAPGTEVPVQLDGELWGRLPMSFRIEPGALNVVR